MARPRKFPEGPVADRQRRSRAARRANGTIAGQVEISRDTADALDRITAVSGETRIAAVARLVREADECQLGSVSV